ncbi:hypothetical protein METY_3045 [Methylopila sp. Yamaguchi]|nr:hypothetical protein METY_3045 [Methylopila sp. Yamaguchi]
MKRAELVAREHGGLSGLRRFDRAARDRDDGVDLRVDSLDAVEMGLDHFDRRYLAGADHVGELSGVKRREFVGHGQIPI